MFALNKMPSQWTQDRPVLSSKSAAMGGYSGQTHWVIRSSYGPPGGEGGGESTQRRTNCQLQSEMELDLIFIGLQSFVPGQYVRIWEGEAVRSINLLNAELNPICCLLALLGAHHFLHVRRIRVKSLTRKLLMSYIYIWSTHSWCF